MGTIAQAKAVSRTATRYLYILNCDAILQKFDTVSRKQVSMTSLAKHSSLIPTHGGQANSVVDGCSTSGAAYQAKTALLYTVSPSTGSIEPGAIRHFRILSFHLPDLTPAAVINLPGKYNDGDSPILKTDRSAQIGVMGYDGYRRIVQGRLVLADTPSDPLESYPSTSNALPPSIDLSSYHATGEGLENGPGMLDYTPVERSGDTVLLQSPR